MINLPEDVAERLYAIYAATMANPLPLEEVVLTDQAKWAYDKGIVKPEKQLKWLSKLQAKAADLENPYDVGVLNALEVVSAIFSERPSVFVDKPEVGEDLQPKVDALKEKLKETRAKFREAKRDWIAEAEKHTKAHTEGTKVLEEKVKELEVDLKNAKSALKTASVTV